MKSLISVVLVASLMGPALPAAARSGSGPTHPFARATAHEGLRVGVGQQGPLANRKWERLRKLEPGTELEVTVRGVELGTRYFILADESGITALNVTADSTWRIPKSLSILRPYRYLGSIVRCAIWPSFFCMCWRQSPGSRVPAAPVPWWPNPC